MEQQLSLLPPFSDDDRRVLERARIRAPHSAVEHPPDDTISDLLQTDDIDLATATLYHHIRSSTQHAAFIQRIESIPPPATPQEIPRVIVMPGAFHAEHAHTGADGRRVIE